MSKNEPSPKTFILKSCNRRFTIFILSLYIFFSILGLIKVNTNFPPSSDMIGSPISPLSKPQHNLIICRIVFSIIFSKYYNKSGWTKGAQSSKFLLRLIWVNEVLCSQVKKMIQDSQDCCNLQARTYYLVTFLRHILILRFAHAWPACPGCEPVSSHLQPIRGRAEAEAGPITRGILGGWVGERGEEASLISHSVL